MASSETATSANALQATVTTPVLNLRAAASDTSTILRVLKKGEVVRVISRAGFWWKVESAGIAGFVAGKYLHVSAGTQPKVQYLYANPKLRTVPLAPAKPFQASSSYTPEMRTCAKAWNAMGGLIQEAGSLLKVEPGAAVAVFCVESGGATSGTGGRMVIRFENHVFFQRWGQRDPDLFAKHFRYNKDERWKGHQFRESGDGQFAAFHGDQEKEWTVLEFARKLDDEAALSSISMGPTQIMGYNCNTIGYQTGRAMFDHFQSDFRYQVISFFDFVKGPTGTSRTLKALQTRDYLEFANNYNGPGQAAVYAERIRMHVEAFEQLRS